ncbi:MAG TPA: hypothetical protein EYP57_03510 [Thermodesulfobacteriaceae bacterium]|nr:hypothetical protein [Thermodesulfobacteriaceae bacterium]
MRCTKCGWISFDNQEMCSKCGQDLKSISKDLGAIEAQTTDFSWFQEDKTKGTAISADTGSSGEPANSVDISEIDVSDLIDDRDYLEAVAHDQEFQKALGKVI